MKTRRIILSFVLCLCALLPLFTLSGCGNVSVSDVKTSFAELDATYNTFADVFVSGSLQNGDLETKYMVKYGVELDEISTDQTKEKFDALESKYNVMLAISSKYIDNNKAFVTALEDENLSGSTSKALKNLNESLIKYNDNISAFVEDRNEFKTHFINHAGNQTADLAALQKFKKSYGELVNKNIQLALDLAEVIETTEIFDLLQSTTPTIEDTKIVKGYISAKMLPIFNNLLIAETETAFSYDDYEGSAKDELDDVVQNLNNLFEIYKQRVVFASNERALASKEDMQKLFDTANSFFTEKDIYLSCVDNLDIYKLIVESETFEEHEKAVGYAKIYFEKIDQFVSITLEDYINNLISVIYED